MSDVMWTPTAEQIEASQMHQFQRAIEAAEDVQFDSWEAFHQWSIDEPEKFWGALWQQFDLIGEGDLQPVVENLEVFPGAKWFPGLRLNFAENLLRFSDDRPALIGRLETDDREVMTYAELRDAVQRLASALKAEGIGIGDRVAAFMPNTITTVVAMLATTSIGAVWSSCSPDFGINGATDRFGQIEPKLLFAVDAYRYNGKTIDCHDKLSAIMQGLPGLQKTLLVPFFESAGRDKLLSDNRVVTYEAFLAGGEAGPLTFERLPFDHPVYINFSSGTTGVPKCIVHGAGGTLLQHQKEHRLHTDLDREDTLFFHSTCGWMMWNWLVSGLACGASLVLYDGSPLARRARALINLIDEEDISVFGVSARYLASIEQAGLKPRQTQRLKQLRAVLSTGSPLNRSGFEYVYRDIKPDVLLASISGGTDIISCFLLGNPTLPVRAGEIQCKGLGMAVEFWQEGKACAAGETGELVCTRPFPSTPVGFWNDPQGERFREAYFSQYPGVWTHGDYGEMTPSAGAIIHGRSDAVLNPSGVRIGTAEIYRQVDKVSEVVEAIAVGQAWNGDERIVLFVRLQEGLNLDQALIDKIKVTIQANTTRRHVPDKIIEVADIPRTVSGKIVEVAVRDVINGRPVANKASLANPEALSLFEDLPALSR